MDSDIIHEFVCANPDCGHKFVTDRAEARRCVMCGEDSLTKSRSMPEWQWKAETPTLPQVPA